MRVNVYDPHPPNLYFSELLFSEPAGMVAFCLDAVQTDLTHSKQLITRAIREGKHGKLNESKDFLVFLMCSFYPSPHMSTTTMPDNQLLGIEWWAKFHNPLPDDQSKFPIIVC